MTEIVSLTFVDSQSKELVLHILASGCSIEKAEVDSVRIVEIGHYFGWSCLILLELVSFEGEEKDRRDVYK